MANEVKSKPQKNPDSEKIIHKNLLLTNAMKEEMENGHPRMILLKTQASKYAQVFRSIAKVIAVGPYNKAGDPEEANVTVVRDFVDEMDNLMETNLDEYTKLVFPNGWVDGGRGKTKGFIKTKSLKGGV